jgi:hypothetical protein
MNLPNQALGFREPGATNLCRVTSQRLDDGHRLDGLLTGEFLEGGSVHFAQHFTIRQGLLRCE